MALATTCTDEAYCDPSLHFTAGSHKGSGSCSCESPKYLDSGKCYPKCSKVFLTSVPITGISWLTVLVSSRIRILNGELWALAIWKGMYVLAVM